MDAVERKVWKLLWKMMLATRSKDWPEVADLAEQLHKHLKTASTS